MKRAIVEQSIRLNFKEKDQNNTKMQSMKSLFFALLCLVSGLIYAEDFDSKIEEVVVFRSGAELYRTANIQLQKGNTQIVLPGLSQYIDKNSIQAKLSTGKIISVDYEVDYLKEGDKDKRIEGLKDSIEMMEFKLKTLQNESSTVDQELKLIKKNIDIKGQAVLDVADLEDFLIFYRNQLPLILSTKLNIETNQKKINRDLKKLKAELRKNQNSGSKRTGKIILEVASNQRQKSDLEINYFMRSASWEPSYNLRSDDLSAKVNLEFKADVRQQSGIEWKDVKLVLATGTPSYEGEMPVMNAWHIDFYRERKRRDKKYKTRGSLDEVKMEKSVAIMSYASGTASPSLKDDYYAVPVEKVSYREYHIVGDRTISSSNKKQTLDVNEYELSASYNYYAAPKLSCKAFLMANVVDWDQHNLLSGKMNVYLDGRYVGKNYLNVNQTEDTLKISMGQDKDIIIERNKLKDKSGKQLIGLKRTKKMDFEISIRNTKGKAINIEIVDQLPISKNDAIKVEAHGIGDAILNKDTKQLSWRLDLEPAASEKINFGFEITYPKSKTLQL